MEKSENKNPIISGTSIARNTIFNLLGYGIPIIFALAIIPFLISGLGIERFGILNIAWIVIGYFSFFDFGVSRALTKIIAEKIGANKNDEIPQYFWTSFLLLLVISTFGAVVLFFLVPSLATKFFNISLNLQEETINAFYILTFSIPIVTTTAGLRGLLEAHQKFGIINIIRSILGISSFLLPLLCLLFTTSLVWIVFSLLFVRIIIWLTYLYKCLSVIPNLRLQFKVIPKLIIPIFRLSGWMTLSNITVPIMIYADRFIIGAVIAASAIAYYTTPYEVASKLLVLPGAISGVLFPAFSTSFSSNPEFAKSLSLRAAKFVFLIMFPLVFLLTSFSFEGLEIWLGTDFALESSTVLQFFALGILFNSLGYIPFAFLEGIGRPDITAKLQLIELPIYVTLIWFGVKNYGIEGAAFIWMMRMAVDSSILFYFLKRQISNSVSWNFNLIWMAIFGFISITIVQIFIVTVAIKIVVSVAVLILFSWTSWNVFLSQDEKQFLLNRISNISHTFK